MSDFQLRQIEQIQAMAGHIRVDRIVTHHEPSIDDAVAIADLWYNGGHIFNGLDDAEIRFCGREEIEVLLAPYDGDIITYLLEKHTLIVGMAGSFLDEHEHPRNNMTRAKGECAASLTARLTGMIDDEYWMSIVSYALADDTGKRTDYKYLDANLTLPNLMKAAYRADADNVVFALDASIRFIHAYYEALKYGQLNCCEDPDWTMGHLVELAQNAEWAQDFAKQFDEISEKSRVAYEEAKPLINNIEWTAVKSHTGKMLNIGLCNTDSDCFAKVALKECRNLDVLVVRRSSGNVQIFTTRKPKINLANVAWFLRMYEIHAKGQLKPVGVDLYQPGEIPACPEWYFFLPEAGNSMIFNGSQTAPDKQPTLLTNSLIMSAIKNGLAERPRYSPDQPNRTEPESIQGITEDEISFNLVENLTVVSA